MICTPLVSVISIDPLPSLQVPASHTDDIAKNYRLGYIDGDYTVAIHIVQLCLSVLPGLSSVRDSERVCGIERFREFSAVLSRFTVPSSQRNLMMFYPVEMRLVIKSMHSAVCFAQIANQ